MKGIEQKETGIISRHRDYLIITDCFIEVSKMSIDDLKGIRRILVANCKVQGDILKFLFGQKSAIIELNIDSCIILVSKEMTIPFLPKVLLSITNNYISKKIVFEDGNK